MTALPPIVAACLRGDVPVLLWGPPGTGKTAAILSAAAADGAVVEVLIGSTIDPIDVGGYLVPAADGRVRVSPPPWVERIRAALDAGRPTWLVLDELSCAPPSVQAALLRVVQERYAAGVDIRGCRVIAAANPPATAADGGWLAPATANRWAHISWTVVPTTWIAGTLGGWGQPCDASALDATIRVTTWISRSPNALLAVPPHSDLAGRAWPSPRSWTHAIRILSCLAHAEDATGCVAACVGEAAAAEWATYDTARDLPPAEDLLAGRVPLPKRGDALYASLLAVVAAAACEHQDRVGRLVAATHLVMTTRPDQAIAAARALLVAYRGDVPPELRSLGELIQGSRLAVQT